MRVVAMVATSACGSGHGNMASDAAASDTSNIADASVDAGTEPNPTYVKASNTAYGVEFGTSVALSADGTTLVVGEPGDASSASGINGNQNDMSMAGAGAAYVYVRAGASWVQQVYVKASNPDAGDHFGVSVALSADGNTLAVGASGEDSASTGIGGVQSDNSATDSGAVYVFTRSGATWTQQAYVKEASTTGTGGGTGDVFGNAVALSSDGNTLAAAAYGEDSSARGINGNPADNAASDSGAVYVFTRSGATWGQQAYIKASNADAGDLFGVSISLTANGNSLAVGAYAEASAATGIGGAQADNSVSNAGAVYTFLRTGSTWTQEAYIKASNTYNGYTFGACVAWSSDGTTLVVGSEGEASATMGIGGNQLDKTAVDSGAVYIFTHSSGFVQQAYVKASNTGIDDRFGRSVVVSADGNTVVVSAFNEDSASTGLDGNQMNESQPNSGAAYLLQRSSSTWTQVHYIKAPNTGYEDNFGHALSLSSNAKTLIVGAPQEASVAKGINGNQADDSAPYAGAAYIFEF